MTKNISIGPWDGAQVQLTVDDNTTIAQALSLAGLQKQASQAVTTYSNAETVNLNDLVYDSETYLLTGQQVSG